jgi:Tat protein secretion system quality control protein TatD with DNase activity
MWIDSHAHLDRIAEPDLTQVIHEAQKAGVARILFTATDLVSAGAVVRQCAAHAIHRGAPGV